MSHEADHILERRSRLLSEALQTRVGILKDALLPAGSRAPFTTQLSKREALRFWQQHRYDDLGKKVLNNMQPRDIMELDLALSQAAESGMMPGEDQDAGPGGNTYAEY